MSNKIRKEMIPLAIFQGYDKTTSDLLMHISNSNYIDH